MAGGHRAGSEEVAERVNAAAALLAGGSDVMGATRELAQSHRLSQRQARRYVERARRGGAVEVPGQKTVFSVKLPVTLAQRVRQAARARRQSISALVAQALAEFLGRHGGGGA
jgi:DNA-binding transcriptional regulator LsrR (DeoR family)